MCTLMTKQTYRTQNLLRNYDTLSCDVKDGGSLLSDVFLSYFYLYCCILVILGFCMQQSLSPMTNAWPSMCHANSFIICKILYKPNILDTYTVREKVQKLSQKG